MQIPESLCIYLTNNPKASLVGSSNGIGENILSS